MHTYLIGGYYGAGNLGDEAILECMLADLRALEEDAYFFVTSWDPQQTRRRHQVTAVHWKDLPAILDGVKKSDLVILGGGGLFQDYWGIDPLTYLRSNSWDITAYGSIPLIAKLSGIPSMIYAVGIGPLSSELALEHTRIVFENSTIATVRDQESLRLLMQSGYGKGSKKHPAPEVLADPVFSLVPTPKDIREAENIYLGLLLNYHPNILGINLRYWDFSGPHNQWLQNISNGIRNFLDKVPDFHLVLIPFQRKPGVRYTNDSAVLDRLSRLLNTPNRISIIKTPLSPGVTQALLGKFDLILGMRLHSLVMGINAEKPVIALPYDPKITGLMKDAGLEDYCCSSLEPDPQELASTLENAWRNKEELSGRMAAFHKKSMTASKRNAELAVELVQTTSKKKVAFFDNLLLQQSQDIFVLECQIKEKEESISSLTNQIAEGRRAALENRFIIDQLTQKVDLLANEIGTLNDQINESQRIQSELIEKNKQIQVHLLESQNQQSTLLEYNRTLKAHIEQQNFQLEKLETEKILTQRQIEENQKLNNQLNAIYSSNSWKLIRTYYNAIDRFPLRNIRTLFTKRDQEDQPQILEDSTVLPVVVQHLNQKNLRCVAIVTSAFEFDPFYNQRVINLTKFLSRQGWGIIFLAWRWSKSEKISNIGKEVYSNVFQIPVDTFLESTGLIQELHSPQKYFILEFPHPDFYSAALKLKGFGFRILYDIVDDWEEFARAGQAAWFDKFIEQATVLNADYLTAVSQPLIDKFSGIRRDIELIPNGFDPAVLGKNHQNISKQDAGDGEINIGYFGHLTDSWFDWDLISKVLAYSRKLGRKIIFHIIGYGEPKDLKIIREFPDSVKFYGRVDPADLHRHVKKWQLAMIPFKRGRLAEAVDPIKIYEYLYFGLPVIVTGITHLATLPGVRVVSGEREFIDAVDSFMTDRRIIRSIQTDSKQRMEQLIRNMTWEKRFMKLIEVMEMKEWIF